MSAPSDAHPAPQEPTVSAPLPATTPARFRLRAVLLVVVPALVLAFAVVALAGFLDVDRLLGDFTRPALAPARGQVFFQGQPLLNCQIMTQPIGGRGVSALGWTDDEGKFSLKSDIHGVHVEGVTVGEHLVTVMAYGPARGASPPPLLTPAQYASKGTTPLRISVEQNSQNEFKLVLEGEPLKESPRPVKGKSDGPDEQ